MRLVLVEWIDAQSDADQWLSRDELNDEPRLIRSVGYQVHGIIPNHVTVAASWDETTDSYGSVMHIPRAMVRKVRRLAAW